MVLSLDDTRLIGLLTNRLLVAGASDRSNNAYYEGWQRLDQLGLAVPPDLRRFETLVNWPRVAVDAIEERLDVKSLMLPGQDVANPSLRDGWDANNLDSDSSLCHLDGLIYGRSFVAVGANDDPDGLPFITVESPREIAVDMDPKTRRVSGAMKLYGDTDEDPTPRLMTLYRPNYTSWNELINGRWVEYDRDVHNLGVTPIVPFVNRRRTGVQTGVSEMADVIGLTDAAARSLTNLQLAGETHSVPQKYVLGASKGDFVDASTGEPLTTWESYFSAMLALGKSDAKFGQFSASDLRNFHETVNHYANLVAGVTGLPMRYLGQNTANPPSADAIRADESRLIKRAERKAAAFGDQWGRVFGLYLRFRDGEWIDGSRIKVEWHDPATPTFSAKADALQKLSGGASVISREGVWDELGWSEARKDRERQYFENEQTDALFADAMRAVTAPPAPEPVTSDVVERGTA